MPPLYNYQVSFILFDFSSISYSINMICRIYYVLRIINSKFIICIILLVFLKIILGYCNLNDIINTLYFFVMHYTTSLNNERYLLCTGIQDLVILFFSFDQSPSFYNYLFRNINNNMLHNTHFLYYELSSLLPEENSISFILY